MNKGSQFKRTDNDIIRAFVKLTNSQDFSTITVREIYTEANISKATFYLHYKDKYDIAEQLQATYLNFFKDIINKLPSPDIQQILEDFHSFASITRYDILEHLKALLKIKTNTVDIVNSWKSLLVKDYLDRYADHSGKALEADIYANILISYILYNLDKPHSSSMVSDFGNALLTSVIHIMQLEKHTDTLFKIAKSEYNLQS